MKKIWIVIGKFSSNETQYCINLKALYEEKDAISFKDEYESNKDIQTSKDIRYKMLYGGDIDDNYGANVIPKPTDEEIELMNNNYDFKILSDFNKCVIQEMFLE